MSQREPDNSKYIEVLIKVGSDIAGGAVGGALGFLSAGPAGAAVFGASGPIITHLLCHIGAEIKDKILGKREQIRIGATLAFATQRIEEKLKNGEQVRDDGFFDNTIDNRSAAEEILEGVLLAAQREHEEKKLKYYGNLVANLAFNSQVSRAQANLLLKLGQNITYQQMCLITIFANKELLGLRQGDYRGVGSFTQEQITALHEIYDLHKNALISLPNDTLLGLTDVNPAKMQIIGNGVILYNLMELFKIDKMDLIKQIELLK